MDVCDCHGTAANINILLRHTHLLVAGNDTVPISIWRGGGVRFVECSLDKLFIALLFCRYLPTRRTKTAIDR